MAIGERIRFIRNLRGMTQKWLGQAVGFPPKTADVRMAQYESGSRTPKEDLVKAIANVLEVSPLALQIPDIDSDLGFIHTLFAIEDIHGIRAEKQGDEVHLIFDGSKRTMDESIFAMLSAWAEQSEKLRCGKLSKEQYDHWRYTFPEEDTTQRWAKVPSQGLSDLLASGIDALTVVVDRALTAYHLNPVVQSLVIDGIFQGVGAVLSFLPIIVTLFFFLSILEDTGYMARVAFVMDKLLRRIGLSGKSVVPMLIGFGCTVPAVMAARTLPSERDRTMTILLTPFMSCSAKIPIYAFFSAAFFPKYAALVMIGLYVLGILFGILSALVLKSAFRGRPVPFVMELPNYRLPSVKSVALLLWDKAKDFIERAFTVIFLATIVIWFLQSFDTRLDVVTSSEQSLLAMVGRWLAPIFAPLGFADWRCATALITGFIAKESVVSTLQILLGTAAVSTLFTAKAALSFLVFTLLYTPCVAAIAAIRRETGSALRAALIALSQCCIAWLAAFAVYHLTLLL